MQKNFFLTFGLLCNSLYSCEKFEQVTIETGVLNNITEINYRIDNERLGFLQYTKIPFFDFYIAHTLYVHPMRRCHGYGKKLLAHAIDHLKTIGACRIYIQPGPFELTMTHESPSERKAKIEKLVKLYTQAGFEPADKLTKFLASILYTVIGIGEDTRYLMAKKF